MAPASAACQAASDPARPAPMTWMGCGACAADSKRARGAQRGRATHDASRFGAADAPPMSRRCVWALDELGLRLRARSRSAAVMAAISDPAYLAMNPNGLVPDAPRRRRWSSGRAMQSCATSRPTTATGTLSRASPRTAPSSINGPIGPRPASSPPGLASFWSSSGREPRAPNAGRDRQSREEAARCFAILDQRLKPSAVSGGETLTYADIVAGIALFRWTTMGTEPPQPPGVAAWHARLRERPAFRKAVEVDYAELVGLASEQTRRPALRERAFGSTSTLS